MMQGQVAGLSILNGDGSPGSAARLEIRGVPSLTGALAPLIVVDNVPMPSDFDINELNPDDVQSIDILKGASSAAEFVIASKNNILYSSAFSVFTSDTRRVAL